jgi:trimeric autotransporter adhesin
MFWNTKSELHNAMNPSSFLPGLRFHVWAMCLVGVVAACASGQTATTTSLTLTSGESQVSSVSSGTMITLSASVTAGSTGVKQGQVNFCDAAAACTDIHLLGTAQLNSSGTAQIQLRPAAGSYSYKAIFLGTPKTTVAYAGSASNSAVLTVTGLPATVTAIAQSESAGTYTLAASVFGFTKSQSLPPPTGSVSFLDTSTGNSSLGTANLTSMSGLGWININNAKVGNEPGAVVAGDFNNDGNLDLAVAVNTTSTTVAILLGDGKGNFTAVASNPITAAGFPVLTQDFNQDGIPDLLLSNNTDGTVTALLGNGDGTFTIAPGSPFAGGYGAFPVFAADFNGDGIQDLAIAGYYTTIWLGNGDGTFTEMPVNSSTLMSISGPEGDFNDDGIPDLLNYDGVNITVFLGNGDGTFNPGVETAVNLGGTSYSLAAADFNGDGKLDLAIAASGGPDSVYVFLGNGDGTFTPAPGSPTQVGSLASQIAVGDFNGDGVADLTVNNASDLTDLFVLLGNGDGTFALASTGSMQLPSTFSAVGDFNGDGVSDLVSSDFYNGTADVYLTGTKQSGASITGVSISGQSPQNVIANYPGDSNYGASASAATALLVSAAAPVFNPPSGAVVVAGNGIVLSSSTPGAGIYYQESGAEQSGWVQYFGDIPLNAIGSITIQAYSTATAYNYGQSATVTATYTVVSSYPVPALSSLSPAFVVAGGQGLTITIGGSGLTSNSTAYLGAAALGTQLVSATQLAATVTSAQIAAAGVQSITVRNPVPGGGTSNALQFEVDTGGGAPPSFTTTSATVSAGASASYPVTLPSSATSVSVSCLNLPMGASCSYSATSGTLTVATSSTTPSGTYQITAVFTETLPGASALAAVFLSLPLALAAGKRKKRLAQLGLLMVALVTFVAVGCGGSAEGGGGGTQSHQVTSSGVVTLIVQ